MQNVHILKYSWNIHQDVKWAFLKKSINVKELNSFHNMLSNHNKFKLDINNKKILTQFETMVNGSKKIVTMETLK